MPWAGWTPLRMEILNLIKSNPEEFLSAFFFKTKTHNGSSFRVDGLRLTLLCYNEI